MPFSYLDHESDVGLESTGSSVLEALESGVQGMLELMVDTKTVRPICKTEVTAEGNDLGGLFVALLNAVLAQRDISGQFFSKFDLQRLETDSEKLKVAGTLWGEPVDTERHDVGAEVKAATYSGLRVIDEPGHVTFRCLLDI